MREKVGFDSWVFGPRRWPSRMYTFWPVRRLAAAFLAADTAELPGMRMGCEQTVVVKRRSSCDVLRRRYVLSRLAQVLAPSCSSGLFSELRFFLVFRGNALSNSVPVLGPTGETQALDRDVLLWPGASTMPGSCIRAAYSELTPCFVTLFLYFEFSQSTLPSFGKDALSPGARSTHPP